ncbi:hypothetical protein [Sphingorhabdus sp. SMR4y]|uniref:hypothetical protein n=1 Tax=Sphingorhabdus sp. SMR4y TaxID=2584094 RepID=UPI000B61D99D|nr:hypothetical protein [Sphingorhabdus sp. SMR4y]ASK87003.1 hypothetical protein SPHFLASMR4Y_00211 [Sphingorhabdus sp. SMR4y]
MTEQNEIGSRMQRLQQFSEASRPRPKSKRSTSPRVPVKRPTAAKQTAANIRAEERSRMMAVFDSPEVSGNEYGAAFLLSNTDMSAFEIIANLSLYPLSQSEFREIVAARQNPSSKTANHGWSDIHSEIQERRTQSHSSTTPAANHGLDDIHAKIQSTRGAVQ